MHITHNAKIINSMWASTFELAGTAFCGTGNFFVLKRSLLHSINETIKFTDYKFYFFFFLAGDPVIGGEQNKADNSFRFTPVHSIFVLSLFRSMSIFLVASNFCKNPNMVQ